MATVVCKLNCRPLLRLLLNAQSIATNSARGALIETKDVKETSIEQEKNISAVTGVPEEHVKNRQVRITVPARNAMQSGTYNTRNWVMNFDTQERWENPLMGWASSADPLSNMELNFPTREAAIAYAETQGWKYEIEEPVIKTVKPKSYGANFSWDKRTRSSTK